MRLVGSMQSAESMTREGRKYFLARVLDDTCRCDNDSGSSLASIAGSLRQLPLQIAVLERSSSVLSAPPLHVDRQSLTTSSDRIRQPVRRTQTISGHDRQPPRQFSPMQRSLSPTSEYRLILFFVNCKLSLPLMSMHDAVIIDLLAGLI